jgi:predicted acetyltransferase
MTGEKRESTRVEIQPARREDAPILLNLLELYSHDFSEICPLDIGDDGRFGYKPLPLYWSESDRHPFLIRSGDRLAGFALVKRGSEVSGNAAVWDFAEFFILRGCRRHGIGTHAVQEVWRRHPGDWEVRVMPSNVPARLFWERAISDFTGCPAQSEMVEKNGKQWHLFSFAS